MGDLSNDPFHESYFGNTVLIDLQLITQDQLNILKSEKQLLQCFSASKVYTIVICIILLHCIITAYYNIIFTNYNKAAYEAIKSRLESGQVTSLETEWYSNTDFTRFLQCLENSTSTVYGKLITDLHALRSHLNLNILHQALNGLVFYRCLSKGQFTDCVNGNNLKNSETKFLLKKQETKKRKAPDPKADSGKEICGLSTALTMWTEPTSSQHLIAANDQKQKQLKHSEKGVVISLLDENKRKLLMLLGMPF